VGVEVTRDGSQPQSDSGCSLLTRPPQPCAFVVHEARVSTDVASLQGIDVHRVAIVAEGPLGEPDSPSTVRLARPSSSQLEVDFHSAGAGMLIVGEHYDPGWTARIDGVVAPVIEADFSALGVRVPAGQHAVKLRFFRAGSRPASSTAALLTLLLFFGKTRRAYLAALAIEATNSTNARTFAEGRKRDG
jgi:hypothetical protein